eukprot:2746275-Pleurochrysis_carterae.AAC.1
MRKIGNALHLTDLETNRFHMLVRGLIPTHYEADLAPHLGYHSREYGHAHATLGLCRGPFARRAPGWRG